MPPAPAGSAAGFPAVRRCLGRAAEAGSFPLTGTRRASHARDAPLIRSPAPVDGMAAELVAERGQHLRAETVGLTRTEAQVERGLPLHRCTGTFDARRRLPFPVSAARAANLALTSP